MNELPRQDVTGGDKFRQLKTKQKNAVDCLVQGKSDQETADAVGVARQTVTSWRNDNPSFRLALNQRREKVWGDQVNRLRVLVREAVDVLAEDIRHGEDPKLRQMAAVHVLRAVGLYGKDLEPGFHIR